MRVRASGIGAELGLICMILVTIGGSLTMIVTVYRGNRPVPRKPVVVAEAPRPTVPPKPATPAPTPVVEPEPVAEDLTPARLAEIAAQEAEIRDAAKAAERRALALEAARKTARSTTNRYRTRERLIRDEAAKADAEARRAEDEADFLAIERDALAQKRDSERKNLEHAQLKARDGVAVLPYKGANGTWRRPIAIECRGATAQLQPGGPMFTFNEMSGFVNRRTHPLVTSVARAMVRSRDLATPDGMPSVPYVLFIVRPDGIRQFYAARGLLEPLGIAFGYELADADWDIEYPDLNDPRQWSETPPGTSDPAWPPPPSADEMAGGSGFGPGGGPRGSATRTGSGTGTGIAAPRTLASAGSPMGGGSGESLEPLGSGSPPGGISGRRAGASPSRYSREETERDWSRLGSRGDSPYGDLEPADLEELGRGNGGSGLFDDGRVPVVPEDHDEAPAFEPPPPSNLPGEFRERRTAQSDPRRDPGRALPSGNSGRVAGLVGESASPPVGTSRSESLSEAIARNEGLVAPRLSVPSRSMPGGSGSGTGTGTRTTTGSPAPGNPASQGVAPGGVAQNPTGASAGMVGASGTPPVGAQASASSSSEGGVPGPQSGPGGGSANGWDDSNGIVSKSFDMNVACGPTGVTIHPGGRSISMTELSASDAALPGALAALVREENRQHPNVGLRPKVKFLIKPGGEAAYLKARWQVSRSGAGWPLTMMVADRSAPRFLDGARP